MVIKHSLLAWAASISFLLSGSLFADTITLKSGEKITGKVLSEDPNEVVIEERISATITDPRTISRADIAKIDKESPDNAAYAALKGRKPGPNSLPAASYDPIIQSLEAFLTQHPQSTHAAEVKTTLASFQEEKKRVAEGDVKLNGQWLSKEEAAKERYQVNGQIVLNHMRDQHSRGDLIGAMNTFDQLEQHYPGSRAYPDGVDLAKQILPALKNNAEKSAKAWQFQKAERERGIQLLSEPAKSQTLAANEREQKAADAAVEAANRANLKWPPLIARSETALITITNRATEEYKRVAALEVSKMRESIQAMDEALKHLGAKELEQAEAGATKALSLWSANEAAVRLQAEVNAARSASPSDGSTEAPAASEEGAEIPAPAAPTATTSDNTAEASEATDSAATDATATAEEGAEEEESPWYKTLPGMVALIVVAILVLAGLNAIRKVSKRANDVLE